MQRLWQVSVRTTAQGEPAAALLLERVFGHPPAAYRDEKTGVITVSVYPERLPAPERALRSGLAAALGRIYHTSKRRVRARGLQEQRDALVGRVPSRGIRLAIKPLRRENWAQSWKRHFRPIEIGNRLLIKPSWSRRRARPGQRVIILDPGLSFGTGQHPTTLFCLQQLARCQRGGKPQSLLDIGSGSGILAIAAAKLGYRPVEAVDCDPEAIRVSLGNIKRNRVRLRLRRADLTRMPLDSRRRYDVVCANLIADLLAGEAEKIRNRLKPGGMLLVAGILRREFPGVRKDFQRFRLTLHESCVHKEWKSGRFALT